MMEGSEMYSDEKSIIPFPSIIATFFSIIVSVFVCILPFTHMHVCRHSLSQSSRYTTVERFPSVKLHVYCRHGAPKEKMMRDVLVHVYFAVR